MPKKKILVVDDETQIAMLLQMRLQAEGYDVLLAEDGAVALTKMKNEKPDLVIMDVFMPRMNGYEAWDKKSQDPEIRKIPMIIMSAKCATKDCYDPYAIIEFMPKPFDIPRFLETVKRLVAPIEPPPGD
ncbi:MAG: response regulator [Candidatus Omnitrophica bacterium]|nr:response regulator [Candidatus Omnitrophota bacterium]